MNPWNIIGWFFIIVAIIAVAGWIIGAVATWLAQHAMHTRTRNDAPKPGDIWVRSGMFIDSYELRIKEVTDDGRVCIESPHQHGHSSWSDSAHEWQRRVKVCKLWRTKP